MRKSEERLIAKFKRRIRSSRAAVFSEFAFLAPILVMFLSAMIELAAFWDARVMANHTAWQIGRIATVRGFEYQGKRTAPGEPAVADAENNYNPKLKGMEFGTQYENAGERMIDVPRFSGPLKDAISGLGVDDRLKTYGDVTALYFMSTAGIGFFGSRSRQANASKLDQIFNLPASGLLGMIKDLLFDEVKNMVSQIKITLPSVPEEYLVFDVVQVLFNQLKSWLEKTITDAVKKLLDPVVDFVKKVVDNLFSAFKGSEPSVYKGDGRDTFARFAYRLGMAADRMKCDDYKLEYFLPPLEGIGASRTESRLWWAAKASDKRDKHHAFTYPQTALRTDERQDYFIKEANIWPANNQKMSVLEIKLDWPFSGMWLFPVVSGFGGKGKTVVAKGNSLHYMQPAIATENLLSSGASEYQAGPVPTKSPLDDLDIADYMRMMAFSIDYRMRAETLELGYCEELGGTEFMFYQQLFDIQLGYTPAKTNDESDEDRERRMKRFMLDKHLDCCRTALTLKRAREHFPYYETPDVDPISWGANSFFFLQVQEIGLNILELAHEAMRYGRTVSVHGFNIGDYWAYRDYLYWPTQEKLRPRYRGPKVCRDHLPGADKIDRNEDGEEIRKRSNVIWLPNNLAFSKEEDRWNHSGLTKTMFFTHPYYYSGDKSDYEYYHSTGDNAVETAHRVMDAFDSEDEVPEPEEGQLLQMARSYDALPQHLCAKEGAGLPVPVVSVVTNSPMTELFSRTFREDLNTLFKVYLDEPQASAYIYTNLTMRSNMITNDESLVVKQALEFQSAMWDIRDQLNKQGEESDDRLNDDMVDQSGIDAFNNQTAAQTATNIVQWWEERKKEINAAYEEINRGIPKLCDDGAAYSEATHEFEDRMKNEHLPRLRAGVVAAFTVLRYQPNRPTTESNALATVRGMLRNSPARQEFLDQYESFRRSYDRFQTTISNQHSNELAWAAFAGAQSKHGSRKLTPEDIGANDQGPKEEPKPPPEGDPTTSGSDDFTKIGEKWKRQGGRWVKTE